MSAEVQDALRVVDRATRLLRQRAGVRPDDARVQLRARAEERGLTLVEAARAVVREVG